MHLLFDLDGTLTDSRPGIMACMRHALAALGLPERTDDELLPFIGPPTHDAFRALVGSADPELNERAIRIYRERYSTIGLFESSVYPGVAEGLAALHAAGIPLWVATSKPQVYARRIIEHFELDRFFRRVYGSELSGERSHKAELIGHILHSEQLSSADTWMFGDRMHDIRGAKANGVRVAGVLWGYGSRAELAEAGADALFASMPELVRAFSA